jgi:hypothetical protein
MASPENGNRTRLELDATVVSVELTLLSIIQGVVLYFLAEASRAPLLDLDYAAWPYIVTGLVILLVFWSRAMIHTFTLIRWPLEYGHNFLYFACALVQAVMLGQVANVRAWFAFGALFVATVWVLFIYDLRLIRTRMREAEGKAGKELFARLLAEQMVNVRLAMPAALAFQLLCLAAVSFWPDRFVVRGGHLVLIALQLAGAAAYQAYVLRWYAGISPLILRCREEWQQAGRGL